jgi:hypothetical protein
MLLDLAAGVLLLAATVQGPGEPSCTTWTTGGGLAANITTQCTDARGVTTGHTSSVRRSRRSRRRLRSPRFSPTSSGGRRSPGGAAPGGMATMGARVRILTDIPRPHHRCRTCGAGYGHHAPAACQTPQVAECGACAIRRVRQIRDPRERRRAVRALGQER